MKKNFKHTNTEYSKKTFDTHIDTTISQHYQKLCGVLPVSFESETEILLT